MEFSPDKNHFLSFRKFFVNEFITTPIYGHLMKSHDSRKTTLSIFYLSSYTAHLRG